MATFYITVGDKTYKVEIDDATSSPVTVHVDGQAYEVQWKREAVAAAPAKAEAVPVTSVPQAPAVAPKPAVVAPTGQGELAEVTAPMPGKVLQVNVQPGDKVELGQQVCTLEAMKMESAIQSTTDGVVISVNVSSGQTVQYGDVLVVLEKGGK